MWAILQEDVVHQLAPQQLCSTCQGLWLVTFNIQLQQHNLAVTPHRLLIAAAAAAAAAAAVGGGGGGVAQQWEHNGVECFSRYIVLQGETSSTTKHQAGAA